MIEKDLAAGLLAKEVDADVLLILTDVPNVYVNYGKEKPESSGDLKCAGSRRN